MRERVWQIGAVLTVLLLAAAIGVATAWLSSSGDSPRGRAATMVGSDHPAGRSATASGVTDPIDGAASRAAPGRIREMLDSRSARPTTGNGFTRVESRRASRPSQRVEVANTSSPTAQDTGPATSPASTITVQDAPGVAAERQRTVEGMEAFEPAASGESLTTTDRDRPAGAAPQPGTSLGSAGALVGSPSASSSGGLARTPADAAPGATGSGPTAGDPSAPGGSPPGSEGTGVPGGTPPGSIPDPTGSDGVVVPGDEDEPDPGTDEPEIVEGDEIEDPERTDRIVLHVTVPDRPVDPLEMFYVRLELDVRDLAMASYAVTLYFDPAVITVGQVLDVSGSMGPPHAAANNSLGFLTVSEIGGELASGRVPIADLLCQVTGDTGSRMGFAGHASIVDMSTGRPDRIRYSLIEVNREIQVR